MHRYYHRIDAILAQIDLISSSIPNRLEAFYRTMKMPAKLSEFGLNEEALVACAKSACARTGTIGQFKKLTSDDVLAIYKSVF